MRVLAVVLALLAAGCVSGPVNPAATPGAPIPLPDPAVVVHKADGTIADASVLAQPVTAALYALGVSAFEPTLGVDPEGNLFYAGIAPGVAVGYEPLVMRSSDAGATWEDVSPRVGPLAMPPETNDPFVYVDPTTGRVFQFAMAPILVCSVLSWSDDQGATWITNPHGCGNTPPWDHQAMVAAPPTATAPTVGYENVLVQCVNNNVASSCARSLDGGLTWAPGVSPFVEASCGGLHGHPVAAPDGTVYLPKMNCGSPDYAMSADSGLTWSTGTVSDVPGHAWPDPAMAVDADGTVYYAYVDEKGAMLLTLSEDRGATWREPVVASPPGVTTWLPAIAAGAAGRIVLAYPGTHDLPDGYASSEDAQADARWHGYLTVLGDALALDPTFVTVRVTPEEDPFVRGPCGPDRCPGMTDFIDVVIGPDGRPYASFVDSCSEECHASEAGENDQSAAVMATLTSGPLLV